MNSLYYTVELLIIAAVPILNSVGIKITYWTIPIVACTHVIQMSLYDTQSKMQQSTLKNMYDQIERVQKNQKDIIGRQKDLKNDVYLGGYN